MPVCIAVPVCIAAPACNTATVCNTDPLLYIGCYESFDKMERLCIPQKTIEHHPHGQRSAAGIYECSRARPRHPNSSHLRPGGSS
eukprot:8976262-Pyramimonas_sp.AAC.1